MMRVHRLLRAGLLTLGVLAGSLAFASVPALAGTGYGPLTGTFGEGGSGDGQFNWPVGVAVDNYPASPSHGEVYVADSFNGRVEKFTAAGAYISQFNGSEAPGGPFTGGSGERARDVAVDPHTGDVWVAAGAVVEKFGPEGKYAGVQLTGTCASPGTCLGSVIPFGIAWGVAVDPSSGDVYVTDYSYHVVDKFTSAGAYVSQFATESGGIGVAVDSEGNVYVAEPVIEGHGEPQVQEFSSAGVLKAKLGSGQDMNVAVDPSSGDVYVDNRGIKAIQVFRAGALIYQFGSLPNNSIGLAVSLNGTIYASEAQANDVKIFAAGPTATKPKTEAAQVEGPFSATLKGELLGGESGYYFAYNTNGRCEGAGKTEPVAVSGTALKESTLVKGLEPITEYMFCIVATNLYGPEFAPPLKFTTSASPPVVEEVGSSGVGPYEATLEAKVNPEKQDTKCVFQYAKKGEPYGPEVPCVPADLGEGYGRQSASLHLENLEGATAYQYRVIVENATGKSEGTGEFTTAVALVPAIEAQSASVESGKEAEPRAVTFAAQVNPELQETTSCVFEYGETKAYGKHASCEPSETFGKNVNTAVGVSAKVSGLVAGVDYHYCVVVEDRTGTSGCKDHVFGPPIVVTGAVLSQAPGIAPSTTAPIGGEVNPESLDTRYYVQYGETEAYGQTAPFLPLGTPLPLGVDAGSGEAPVVLGSSGICGLPCKAPPDISLEALTPGATYHYRLVAYNADGTTPGADMTVTVLPAPQVGPASVSEVTQSSATISTSVNPEGLHTLYKLDVGTSAAYGTPHPGDAGSGSAPVPLTFHLSGLHAGDTYHFRLVASNSDGSSSEGDQTFTTAATVVEVPIELIKAPSELGPVPVPSIAFPTETKPTTTKALSRAQKLKNALKACKKKRPKSKRVACEKQAHKQYGPLKKKKKK
jgi:hypothetical protein